MALNEITQYDLKFHHRRSIRLRGYDYSQCGAYFITICVQRLECLFGMINNGNMILNDYGKIVKKCWYDIQNHYLKIELPEFVVMPNHCHGIIIVGAGLSRPENVEKNAGSLDKNNFNNHDKIGRDNPAPTIGNVVGYFKYIATKQINTVINNGVQKIFQRNYYEHMIRNENEYNNIAQYIKNNPLNWLKDKNYIK